MITRRYRLDEINEGYRDLLNGEIIRGVIDFSLRLMSPSSTKWRDLLALSRPNVGLGDSHHTIRDVRPCQ